MIPVHNYGLEMILVCKEESDELMNKKEFDRSVCFTFFGNWLDCLKAMENEYSLEDKAYQMFKIIARYALYEEAPDCSTDPTLPMVWPLLKQQIDASVANRKRGFALPGPSDKQRAIIDCFVEHPELSQREIADILGVSKTTVNQTIRKFEDDPEPFGYCIDTYEKGAGDEAHITYKRTGADDFFFC